MSEKHYPAVSISLNHAEGSEEGSASDFVVIDVKDSEDVSCGFIALDDPSDLHKLRAAIDIFIQEHKIQPKVFSYDER